MYYSARYNSPIGEILLAGDEHNNIIGLWFADQQYIADTIPEQLTENADLPVLRQGMTWLDNYFAGLKPGLSALSLAPAGSIFRQQVWKVLMEILYGQLTTSGSVAKEAAKRMGKVRMSARAVGGAVGNNPISVIIPCHRVIGSDGSLTGYAGGIEKKIMLLRHEGVDITQLNTINRPAKR